MVSFFEEEVPEIIFLKSFHLHFCQLHQIFFLSHLMSIQNHQENFLFLLELCSHYDQYQGR